MEAIIQERNGNEAVISVTVEKADYQTEVDNHLKKLRKQVNIPGFRPGTAPMGMVNKMYGLSVKVEQVEKAMQKGINKILTDEKLDLLLQPISRADEESKMDWKKDESFSFKFDVGIRPEINIDFNKLNGITKYNILLSDELLEKETMRLREHYAENIPLETFQAGDDVVVGISFQELDDEGKEAENLWKTFRTLKSKELPVAFIEAIQGKAENEQIVLDLKQLFTHDELHNILSLKDETIHDLGKNIRLELKQIAKRSLAELNYDLFSKVFPDSDVTTEEQFKEKQSENIQLYLDSRANAEYSGRLQKALLETHPLDLPINFLTKYYRNEYNADGKKSEEDMQQEVDRFLNDIHFIMLQDAILTDNNIEISEEDIWEEAFYYLKNMYSKMGIGNLDDNIIASLVANYLKEEKNYSNISLQAKTTKLFNLLLEKIEAPKEDISLEAFEEISNPQSAIA